MTSLVAAVVIFFAVPSPRRDTPDSFSDKRETAAQANPPENNQTLNPGLSGAAI
ncbi:hypothetical protein LOY64_15010 [Pseudomonas corrugata]|uniref:hypothetical protein n=1 Tax=Pseudomonas corrugata TaxID=47879 RepID=UPI00222F0F96|nr:hypothetical protein [Pseudomonas corrugata]UZD98241.1 hypothetical protein LOY64_15010 [Pseudomonas corrugata]UZE08698.1 hypothetical protein LOY65_12545 [Pseudomonas corrugata]